MRTSQSGQRLRWVETASDVVFGVACFFGIVAVGIVAAVVCGMVYAVVAW